MKCNQNTKLFIHKMTSENIVCEVAAILSMGRWVNQYTKQHLMELNFISNSDIKKDVYSKWQVNSKNPISNAHKYVDHNLSRSNRWILYGNSLMNINAKPVIYQRIYYVINVCKDQYLIRNFEVSGVSFPANGINHKKVVFSRSDSNYTHSSTCILSDFIVVK